MAMSALIPGTVCLSGLIAGPVLAQDKKDPIDTIPSVASDVFACRLISENNARLACYDKTVGPLYDARINQEIVVADREQIDEARRGLFGLSLKQIKLFGSDDDDVVQEITSTLTSARPIGNGKYLLVLEDGAVWQQTEPNKRRAPKSGDSIVITRGLFGSFLATVNDERGVKVQRIAQ